jgi:hypothetical protein
MNGRQTVLGVEQLRRAVSTVLATETVALAGPDLTGLLVDLEVVRRQLDAAEQLVVAEINRQGLFYEYGCTATPGLLTQLLNVSPHEAKARVARARDLGPRRGMTGEPLEPILPITAAAIREGAIHSGHVDVIAKCLDALPAEISYQASAAAEQFLVTAARNEHPGQLKKTAAMLLARLDPDGVEPREQELEHGRAFGLRKYQDGSSTPTGRFTPEQTAMWEAIFDSLAAPQSSLDGEPDTRTAEQRRHDAAAEVLQRVLRSGTLPETGGVPVTVLIRTTVADLQDEKGGVAVTSHGTQISTGKLLEMSGDAHFLSAVCSDTGGIMSYGRERRLASREQRFALAGRDGGCCFVGCDRPGAWCEVHHVIPWIRGGPTDIDNMALLCRYHHRHFETLGWEVFIQDGTPWWRPPAWIDPERKPIQNTTHHLDDIKFSLVA